MSAMLAFILVAVAMALVVVGLLFVIKWAIDRQRARPGWYLVESANGQRRWIDEDEMTARYDEVRVIERRTTRPALSA